MSCLAPKDAPFDGPGGHNCSGSRPTHLLRKNETVWGDAHSGPCRQRVSAVLTTSASDTR